MPYSAPDALNDCNVLAVSDGVILPTHELLENGGVTLRISFFGKGSQFYVRNWKFRQARI